MEEVPSLLILPGIIVSPTNKPLLQDLAWLWVSHHTCPLEAYLVSVCPKGVSCVKTEAMLIWFIVLSSIPTIILGTQKALHNNIVNEYIMNG